MAEKTPKIRLNPRLSKARYADNFKVTRFEDKEVQGIYRFLKNTGNKIMVKCHVPLNVRDGDLKFYWERYHSRRTNHALKRICGTDYCINPTHYVEDILMQESIIKAPVDLSLTIEDIDKSDPLEDAVEAIEFLIDTYGPLSHLQLREKIPVEDLSDELLTLATNKMGIA